MGSVLKKELKIFYKRKGNFFWLLVMPIVFIVIMSFVFSTSDTKVTLHIINQDQSAFSKTFVKQLDDIPVIEVKQDKENTLNEQIDQLKKGNISSLVVIPKGFGDLLTSKQQTTVQLYRVGSSDQVASAVDSVLNNFSNVYRDRQIQTTLQTKGETKSEIDAMLQPPIQVKTINESSTAINAVTQVVPGYMIMFVFFIIMTMATRFAQERDSGMVSRIKSTSLRSWEYLVGMWLPSVFTVILQCAVLLGFGHFVYDLALGNIAVIGLIVLCLSICGTGIGLAISLLVQTDSAGKAITQLFTLGGAMLGGLWVPYDILPPFVQTIGHFTPQYWAQHAFIQVMSQGAGFADVWLSIVVLLAIGIAGLLVGILAFPKFLRSAVN